MKQKDFKILAELRRNSRATLVEIGRKTRVPVATVFDRIVKLEKSAIARNVMLLDFARLGFPVRMQYLFTAKQGIDDFLHHPNLNYAAQTSKEHDFAIEMFFRTPAEADIFEETLEQTVQNVRKVHMIEELKREAAVIKL